MNAAMGGRVNASATVDAMPSGLGYRVRVWGEPPHETERTYAIRERSEDRAAMEGLRLFAAEMSGPIEARD